jgi:flagellar hook-associated protein FlgK
MTDLIGIGVSGLSAYQRALATTSNNVANLQTEGYVRQRAVLASSGQDATSVVSIGTGVRFAEVQRLYDQFAEENLQRAGAALEAEQGLLKELQALQDAIGSSEIGLHGAFQDFFDGARELEAAPASAGARAGFLAKADGLAARFRGLAATAFNLDSGTRAQIDQAVRETNTRLTEIASLNAQLLKRGSASEQPMQLLDQRDNAIRELAKRLGVTAVIGPGGAANLYAGESASGVALVENGVARTMTAVFDPYDFGKAEFVLDAASRPVVLPGINTGKIGGLVGFRREGLGLVVNKLDELALSFGRAVNKLHRAGLDSAGRPGEDLFYVGPKFTVEARANAGSGRLSVTVVDPDVVKSSAYEMTFNASAGDWQVREIRSGRTVTSGSPVQMDGLRFAVEGFPRDGDTFRITPEDHPVATFAALIKDGSQVASAGMFAVRSSAGNLGATAAEMTLTASRESAVSRSITDILPTPKLPVGEQSFPADESVSYQDTLVAARATPIAFIPAGYSKIALSTALGEGSELAVFTRDGRQISGPEMDPSVVRTANGFFASALYSKSYLNKTGSEGYLDRGYSRGLYAESGRQLDVEGNVNLTPARIYGEAVSASEAGVQTLIINGKSVQVTLTGLPAGAGNIVDELNAARESTGVVAEQQDGKLVLSAYNAVRFDVGTADAARRDRISVTIDGGEYTVGFRQQISASSLNAGTTDSIELNGKKFLFTSLTDLKTKLDAGLPGINADLSTGKLTLTVAADGSRIKVGRNTIGLQERDDLYLADDLSLTRQKASDRLVQLINGAGTRVVATGGLVKADLELSVARSATLEGAYDIEADEDLGAAGFVIGDRVRITAGGASVGNKNKDLMVVAVSGNTLTCKPIDGSTLIEETGAVGCTLERAVRLTNRDAALGAPIVIGTNTLGLAERSYFNDSAINLDIAAGADRAAFGSLGFRSGFVMREALAEDLLVFGVDERGTATSLSLSGTYSIGAPPAELLSDARRFSLAFDRGNYRLTDIATGTEVSSGVFDTNTRTVQYANWSVTLQTLPSDGDSFTILKNDDASGDNRVISLIANLQYDRSLLPSNQTVQQEYEDLVNKIGVQTVQAEIGRDAQKVVFDQAQDSRDRVSGVNLDEELSDLLRYQQAYQANAQVIQTASRLFDTLMQRL